MKMTMDKSSKDVYANQLRWIGLVIVGLVLQTGGAENLLLRNGEILRQRTLKPLVDWPPVSAKGKRIYMCVAKLCICIFIQCTS